MRQHPASEVFLSPRKKSHFKFEEFEEALKITGDKNIYLFRRAFLTFCIRGLQNFINQDYQKLDPHVGDTACHLRACQYIYLATEKSEEITRKMHPSLLDKMKNETYFIKRKKFDYSESLSENIVLFGLSSFLTKFRIPDEFSGSRSINIQKLVSRFHISRTFSERLIQISQKILTNISCRFAFQLARKINYPWENVLKTLLQLGDGDRTLLPCFFYSDLIWRYLHERKIPTSFVFLGQKKITEIPVRAEKDISNKPVFQLICSTNVTEISEIQNDVFQYADDIFYGNVATHPQYPGRSVNPVSNNPFSLLNPREKNKFEFAENILCGYQRYSHLSVYKISHIRAVRPVMPVSRSLKIQAKISAVNILEITT